MGGHTMREGLTVGRSLSAAAIVRLGRAGVNGALLLSPLDDDAGDEGLQVTRTRQLGVIG